MSDRAVQILEAFGFGEASTEDVVEGFEEQNLGVGLFEDGKRWIEAGFGGVGAQ